MKNRRFFIFVVVLVMFIVSGCSLAKEGAGEENAAAQDRMIGVVITREYVDLFHLDAFLQDNASEMADGEEIDVDDTSAYQGRIYATVEKNGSEDKGDWEFYFEGIQGINYFALTIEDKDLGEYVSTISDDEICESHVGIHSSDAENKIELSAKVYAEFEKGKEEYEFYLNPVYQTKEGDIYMTSGNGVLLGGKESDINSCITSSYAESVDFTENGESSKVSFSVNIEFILQDEPIQITMHHLSDAHQILKTEMFSVDEVPEEVKAAKGTAYILVETELKNEDDEIVIQREIFEQKEGEETYITTLHAGENGMFSKKSTIINW